MTAPETGTPVETIRKALLGYRVMAWTTGIWLIALCYEMVLKYVVHVDNPPNWIAIVHGWVYFVYLIFTANLAIEDAQEFYADVKERARKYGRNPDDLIVLPGASIFVGRTAGGFGRVTHDRAPERQYRRYVEGVDRDLEQLFGPAPRRSMTLRRC